MLNLDPSTHIYKYEGVNDGSSGRLLLDECDEWSAITLRTPFEESRKFHKGIPSVIP